MKKISAIGLAICFATFIFLLIANHAMATPLKIGVVYKSLNDMRVIEIISENKLKITKGKRVRVANYSISGSILSVELGDTGTERVVVESFKIIPEGLREVKMGGYILYSPKKYKMGLLHRSARAGDMGTVKSLLGNGIDVNIKSTMGATALMHAATKGHTEVAKLLIDKGAQVNAKNNFGWTALMKAVTHGHLKTVQLLIDRGSMVNAKNNKGSTPLKLAIKNGYQKIVHILRNSGARE